MRGKMRTNKLISFYLRKLLPTPLTGLIVRLKGTGTREQPKMVTPQNAKSLKCTIVYNQYGSFCTPDTYKYDEPVQYTYRGEQYEAESIDHIRGLNLNGDIIHAGAYFGDSIPGLATALKSDAKLWAFEPNEESYRCAQITILLNNLTNVHLENCALGESEGTLNLLTQHESSTKKLGGTARVVEHQTEKTRAVRVRKLDDIIPENRKIALIHLDVEGFEEQVLRGAQKILARDKPYIIVEVNLKKNYQVLERIGYSFVVGLDQRNQHEGFRNALFSYTKELS